MYARAAAGRFEYWRSEYGLQAGASSGRQQRSPNYPRPRAPAWVERPILAGTFRVASGLRTGAKRQAARPLNRGRCEVHDQVEAALATLAPLADLALPTIPARNPIGVTGGEAA